MMILKPLLLPVWMDEFLTLFLKRLNPRLTPKSFEDYISSIASFKSDFKSLNFFDNGFASFKKLSLYSIIKLAPKFFYGLDSA
jgi:hypothetical protein